MLRDDFWPLLPAETRLWPHVKWSFNICDLNVIWHNWTFSRRSLWYKISWKSVQAVLRVLFIRRVYQRTCQVSKHLASSFRKYVRKGPDGDTPRKTGPSVKWSIKNEWGGGGVIFESQWRVNILGSSGENSGIVTGGLEIELTGASAVLHDVALERHPSPHPYRRPYVGSWRG